MSIQQEVINIISRQLKIKPDHVHLKDRFSHLKADSLDMAEIIMSLEENFDLDIPDADANQFATIESVVQYIKKKKN